MVASQSHCPQLLLTQRINVNVAKDRFATIIIKIMEASEIAKKNDRHFVGLDAACPAKIPLTWLTAGLAVIVATAAVAAASGWLASAFADRPVFVASLALFLAASGGVFAWFVHANQRSAAAPSDAVSGIDWRDCRWLLIWIFAVGLVARLLLLLASSPLLENDYYRYLWEGGLTAHGHSPYLVTPTGVGDLPYNDARLELAKAAGDVFERVAHPTLSSVYPPVAQAAFALAHWLSPWSLTAWRLVLIVADIATFLLLVALLQAAGRPAFWVAFYWWCPLVLKELANSAHMEAVLIPLVLTTLLASVRRRPLLAVVCLGLAAGVKVWPLMLAPLVLRPLSGERVRLVAAMALLSGIIGLMAWPIVASLDRTSGFVAFAAHWATNSAHMPLLEAIGGNLFGWRGAAGPGLFARAICGAILLVVAVGMAVRPWQTVRDLLQRGFVVVSAIVLLSPAQFPWYVLWVLPLAVLAGSVVWHVAAATVSLYYMVFFTRVLGWPDFHRTVTVWVIWLPVWCLVARELWRHAVPVIADRLNGRDGMLLRLWPR
jgi:alpha-1,6-mannosyltransferase